MNIYCGGISKLSSEQKRNLVAPVLETDADVIPTRAFAAKNQVTKLKTVIHSAIVDWIDEPESIKVVVSKYNEAVVHEVEDDLERKGWDVERYYGNDRIVTLVIS